MKRSILFFITCVCSLVKVDSQVLPTREWINVWGDAVKINREFFPQGSIIHAFAKDTILCGESAVTITGGFGLMSIYRSDAVSTVPGANVGDTISFLINGKKAKETLVWTANGDIAKLNLTVEEPRLQLSVRSVDFGNMGLLSSNIMKLTVQNVGLRTLSIDSIVIPALRHTQLSANVSRLSIASDSSKDISIFCKPLLDARLIKDSLNIYCNDPSNNILSLPLTGSIITDIVPTPDWMNFWTDSAFVDNIPVKIGDIVDVYDQAGKHCGNSIVSQAGLVSLFPIYGDDTTSIADEGARTGELLTFAINGCPVAGRGSIAARWNGSGSPLKLALYAYSNQPMLSAMPSTVLFPPIRKGDSTSTSLGIRSQFAPVRIDSVKLSGTTFLKNASTVFDIEKDSTSFFNISFRASTFGTFADTLKIFSRYTTLAVVVRASSPYPSCTSSKSFIAFRNTAKSVTKKDSIQITNGSINFLKVDSIYTKTSAFTVDRVSGTVGTDTLRIAVSFAPTSVGTYADTVYLRNNSLTPVAKIALSGSTPAPIAVTRQKSLSYPNTVKGDSSSFVLVVMDSSISPLAISSITVGTTYFSVWQTAPVSINGNDSLQFAVRFKPSVFGTVTDTLKIFSDGGNINVVLTGTSPYSALTSLQSSLAFGNIAKKGSKTIVATITNGSINKLVIDSIYTLTRRFSPDKSQSILTTPDTLKINVIFRPDTFAVYTDTLLLRNNSLNQLVKIPMSGNSPPPQLTVSLPMIDFGNVALTDTVYGKLKVYNKTTTNSLTISRIQNRVPAFYINSSTQTAVNPNDSLILTIRFNINSITPSGYGTWLDTLSISSDGGNATTIMKGFSPYPAITVTPDSIAFGKVKKDSTLRMIVVKNTSINFLQVDSLWTKSKYFNVTKTLANRIIKNGDSLLVPIFFKTDSVGSFIDALYIANNSPNNPLKIPLSGTRDTTTTGVMKFGDEIPKVYSLSQNFPNPYNPSTTIRFGVPQRSQVRLVVYNLLGQQVIELVNQEINAGYFERTWHANVSSGLYFYRLEAVSVNDPNKRFVDVKKMILLK